MSAWNLFVLAVLVISLMAVVIANQASHPPERQPVMDPNMDMSTPTP